MKTEKNIYFPLFASRQLNGGFQDAEESRAIWKTIQDLPAERRNILLSQNLAEAIALLDEQFHIPDQFVEYITVLVREMFFGNLSEQEVLRALRNEFTKLPNLPIENVIQHIQLNIFKAEPDPEEIDEEEEELEASHTPENLKQYTLLDALAKYSNLTNQFVTTENIKLKSQATLVRPTLSNWLKNYRDELGIGKHDAVARARFLFETVNTKKLSSEEREHIHAIVRSVEDNELLDIDPIKQEIVFLNEQRKEAISGSQRQRFQASDAASPDIFERFQNIPAREELKNVGTQTFVGEKSVSEKKNNEEEAVLSRIKNMLVTPAQANAPAPQEDFLQAREMRQNLPVEEPLGTLRFSAKHVLPAERQSQLQMAQEALASPSRLEHFRPRDVPIPGSRNTGLEQPKSTGPQYVVHTTKEEMLSTQTPIFPPTPVSSPPQPSASLSTQTTPVLRKTTSTSSSFSPPSIFRIKPNKS